MVLRDRRRRCQPGDGKKHARSGAFSDRLATISTFGRQHRLWGVEFALTAYKATLKVPARREKDIPDDDSVDNQAMKLASRAKA